MAQGVAKTTPRGRNRRKNLRRSSIEETSTKNLQNLVIIGPRTLNEVYPDRFVTPVRVLMVPGPENGLQTPKSTKKRKRQDIVEQSVSSLGLRIEPANQRQAREGSKGMAN